MSANQKSQECQNPTTEGKNQTNPLNSNQAWLEDQPNHRANEPYFQDRIDLLQKHVKTLIAAVERMATTIARRDQRPNSMPSLENDPMIPADVAARNQINGD